MTQPRRRGRRPAGEDTKAALVAAARETFISQGYTGATVRAIAGRAGIDPAMVNHWFGGKAGLFAAALELPVNPDQVVAHLLDGDREELAERVVRTFLGAWDPARGGGLTALLRSVASHDEAAAMLRDFLANVVIGRVIAGLGVDQPELRMALCATQIAGLGLVRYVIRLEPVASAGPDELAAAIAPNLQRYLTGELS